MFRASLFLALVTLIASVPAFAAPKISLITVSPGDTLFDAFGHSAFLVEADDGSNYIYEYGNVSAQKLFLGSNPMKAFVTLFNSQVKTRVSKMPTTIHATTKLPLYFRAKYLGEGKAYRELLINRLELSDAQAEKLVAGFETDIAAGDYNYENYTRNCATGPRDRLFADDVLGADSRKSFENKVDLSLTDVAMESIDEAAALSNSKTVKLFDDSMSKTPKGKKAVQQATMMLSFLEIPVEYKSSKDLYASLAKADAQLGGESSTDEMGAGFHKFFFAAELKEKPITEWRTMYTPKRVRAALLKTVNPATGKPVIDLATEIKGSNPSQAPVPPAPATP